MTTATMPTSRALDVFTRSSQPLLRRIRVEETDEEVVLAGSLPTYFLKQLAQETVRPYLGQRRLSNRITVN